MTAVDTNVLVRLLTADDPAQARRARNLFAQGPVWVGKTVLLETEWVLRSAYGISPQVILAAFQRLSQTAGVQLEDPYGVERSLELYGKGFDLADALHLVSCRETADTFATFDKRFRTKASRTAGLPKVMAVGKS